MVFYFNLKEYFQIFAKKAHIYIFCFVLQCIERKMFTIEIDDGREVP